MRRVRIYVVGGNQDLGFDQIIEELTAPVGMTIAIQALALVTEAVLLPGRLRSRRSLRCQSSDWLRLPCLVLLLFLVGLLDIGLAALCIGQGRGSKRACDRPSLQSCHD